MVLYRDGDLSFSLIQRKECSSNWEARLRADAKCTVTLRQLFLLHTYACVHRKFYISSFHTSKCYFLVSHFCLKWSPQRCISNEQVRKLKLFLTPFQIQSESHLLKQYFVENLDKNHLIRWRLFFFQRSEINQSLVGEGLYKHWYAVVLLTQRKIMFNNYALCIITCQYVENLRWEYNPGVCFTVLAQLASGKSSQ